MFLLYQLSILGITADTSTTKDKITESYIKIANGSTKPLGFSLKLGKIGLHSCNCSKHAHTESKTELSILNCLIAPNSKVIKQSILTKKSLFFKRSNLKIWNQLLLIRVSPTASKTIQYIVSSRVLENYPVAQNKYIQFIISYCCLVSE